MRRALHLLLMLALVCCALHIGEEAHAHESAELHELERQPAPDHAPAGAKDKVAHGGHHHCPVAPEEAAPLQLGERLLSSGPHCARPVAALASLSRAPPLQPPSA